MKVIHKSLTVAVGLLLTSSVILTPVSAAPVFTNAAPQSTAFTVAAGDLLETSVATRSVTRTSTSAPVNETTNNTAAGSITFSDSTDTGSFIGSGSISNGSFGALPATTATPKNRADFIGITSDVTINYSFDLTSTPTGYDIASIDIFTGANNNGRDGIINLQIFYATVSNPTTFVSLGTVTNNPTVASNTPVANKTSITDTTGVLASGVSNLRFVFGAQENNGVFYREIDVVAVPEPSTLALGLIGAAGLLLVVQRSRAQRIA